jgi:hypothetical protein
MAAGRAAFPADWPESRPRSGLMSIGNLDHQKKPANTQVCPHISWYPGRALVIPAAAVMG